jgi:hypothetical protein
MASASAPKTKPDKKASKPVSLPCGLSWLSILPLTTRGVNGAIETQGVQGRQNKGPPML